MPNYIVPSDQNPLQIPDVADITQSSMYVIAYGDVTGTQSSPEPRWTSSNMYAYYYKSGANVIVAYRTQSGTEQTVSASTYPYNVICAYTKLLTPGDETSAQLNIVLHSGFDFPNIISQIQSGEGIFLYSDLLANAIASGIVKDTTWDPPDHPSYNPDYDPTVPQGGENAEITPITSESCLPELIPTDPLSDDTDDPTHVNIKMVSAYVLTASQVKDMGRSFWDAGANGFIDNLSKVFLNGCTDPMAAIAGFIRLPIAISHLHMTGQSGLMLMRMYLGGVLVDGPDAGDAAHVTGYITNRFVEMTYSKTIGLSFGTYYDFTKTKISIYLPYIGQVPLNTAMVMNGTIYANYTVDCYTGDLTCTLQLYKAPRNNYDRTLSSIIGRYKGNCALPVQYSRGNTEGNAQNIFNGILGLGLGAAGLVSGHPLAAAAGVAGTAGRMMADQRIQTEAGGGLSASGVSGWLDVQYPYLIIERDVPLYPENWRALDGAEQYATFTVGSLSGYTRFRSIHIEIAGATSDENEAIESILKQGVIL